MKLKISHRLRQDLKDYKLTFDRKRQLNWYELVDYSNKRAFAVLLNFVLKIFTKLKSPNEFNKFVPGDNLTSVLWKNYIKPVLPIEIPIF